MAIYPKLYFCDGNGSKGEQKERGSERKEWDEKGCKKRGGIGGEVGWLEFNVPF